MFSTELDFSNDQPPLADDVTISSETPTNFLPGARILLLRGACGGLCGLQSRSSGSSSSALLAPAWGRGPCHVLDHHNHPTWTGKQQPAAQGLYLPVQITWFP